jgi:hypothetical protein
MIHYVEYVLSGTVTDNDGHRLQIGSARWGCGSPTVELAVKFKLPVIGVACAGLCLLLRVVLRPWVTSGLRNSM